MYGSFQLAADRTRANQAVPEHDLKLSLMLINVADDNLASSSSRAI